MLRIQEGSFESGRSDRGRMAGTKGINCRSSARRASAVGEDNRYVINGILLGTTNRYATARRAGEVWQLERDLSALSAVEQVRCLRRRSERSRRGYGRERPPQQRQHFGPHPSLGSGWQRGIHRRALGRSRGGCTCKIHRLADAKGGPIAFRLTPGRAADCKACKNVD
jgi:hypothetical protein